MKAGTESGGADGAVVVAVVVVAYAAVASVGDVAECQSVPDFGHFHEMTSNAVASESAETTSEVVGVLANG